MATPSTVEHMMSQLGRVVVGVVEVSIPQASINFPKP